MGYELSRRVQDKLGWKTRRGASARSQKAVCAVLADYASDTTGKNARPALATIARRVQLSRRAVQFAIDALLEMGLITLTRTSTRHVPDEYAVNLAALDALPDVESARGAETTRVETSPLNGARGESCDTLEVNLDSPEPLVRSLRAPPAPPKGGSASQNSGRRPRKERGSRKGVPAAGQRELPVMQVVAQSTPPPPIAAPDVPAEMVDDWRHVRRRLAVEVGDGVFASWLKPSRLVAIDGGVVRLAVPTRFMRDKVRSLYGASLARHWQAVRPGITAVEIEVYPNPVRSDAAG